MDNTLTCKICGDDIAPKETYLIKIKLCANCDGEVSCYQNELDELAYLAED